VADRTIENQPAIFNSESMSLAIYKKRETKNTENSCSDKAAPRECRCLTFSSVRGSRSFSCLRAKRTCGFLRKTRSIRRTYFQEEAEVGGRFVFALKVFSKVDIQVVELDETDEVPGRLEEKSGMSLQMEPNRHFLTFSSSFIKLINDTTSEKVNDLMSYMN